MIILTGEPGIGKTALLRAVVEQASRSGSMVRPRPDSHVPDAGRVTSGQQSIRTGSTGFRHSEGRSRPTGPSADQRTSWLIR